MCSASPSSPRALLHASPFPDLFTAIHSSSSSSSSSSSPSLTSTLLTSLSEPLSASPARSTRPTLSIATGSQSDTTCDITDHPRSPQTSHPPPDCSHSTLKMSPYYGISPSISSLDLVDCEGFPLVSNPHATTLDSYIGKNAGFPGHYPPSPPSTHTSHRLPPHTCKRSPPVVVNLLARLHSPSFPSDHQLNSSFAHRYELGDELGSGGFGFVMTARHRERSREVAVKFIIKDKIPTYAYMEDDVMGRMPTEILLLTLLDHENIVKCLDLYEDNLYYYMIQELHGSPWQKRPPHSQPQLSPASTALPELSPSTTMLSIDSTPPTPPQVDAHLDAIRHASSPDVPTASKVPRPHDHHISCSNMQPFSSLLSSAPCRPSFSRRPSHDLFECIETSEHKRLPEDQARQIFAQVVEAVHYLDGQGIAHRDIKDENILIDDHCKVKLIDFGSASVVDPLQPRPYYDVFFGTTAYASSEILLKKPYQAAPAEVWTLGVLLSYLLTGASPFPTERDAIHGRIVPAEHTGNKISKSAMHLMRRCLDPNPKKRAKIDEVRSHAWLTKH